MHSAVTRAHRSGWTPAAAVLLLAIALLLSYDTPAVDIAKYGAYLLYGLVAPGTLIYRALRGEPRSLVEDLAAGTAVGYAIELGVYLAARAVGAPLAVALWPAVVIVTFLAAPRLRRHWRLRHPEIPRGRRSRLRTALSRTTAVDTPWLSNLVPACRGSQRRSLGRAASRRTPTT